MDSDAKAKSGKAMIWDTREMLSERLANLRNLLDMRDPPRKTGKVYSESLLSDELWI